MWLLIFAGIKVKTVLVKRNPDVKREPNGRHFVDIFECIFLTEDLCIWIEISLGFIPKGTVDSFVSDGVTII